MKLNKPAVVKLSERDIEDTCTQFLELDGWRCIKTDLPHLRGLGVQEKGMADRLYIRSLNLFGWTYPGPKWAIDFRISLPGITNASLASVLWIEWKKKGGKAAEHQLDWHRQERARGALTWIAGIDFPASIEGFTAHYKASGLMRKRLS